MPYLADGTGHQAADTSQEAAERIAPDASRMRALVLDTLDAMGDMTADEIAYLSDVSVWSIRPRVTELYQRGYIERTGERRKNLSGASANVYRRRITDIEGTDRENAHH